MPRAQFSTDSPIFLLNSFLTLFWKRDTLFNVCVRGSECSNERVYECNWAWLLAKIKPKEVNMWSTLGATRVSMNLRDSSGFETVYESLRMRAQRSAIKTRGVLDVHAHDSVYQEVSLGSAAYIPKCQHLGILGTRDSNWADWTSEPSWHSDPPCRYTCVMYFLISGLHPAQPKRGSGWGFWCCLCSLSAVCLHYLCGQLCIQVVYMCALYAPPIWTTPALLLLDTGTWSCSSLTPLRLSDPAQHIFL